jgi:hypothetical protein
VAPNSPSLTATPTTAPTAWVTMNSPRMAPYKDALARMSARTGASVPSLVASFLVLHEVTAIVPFVGIFFASRALGLGEQTVAAIVEEDDASTGGSGDVQKQVSLVKRKTREWVDEGGQFAERLGRRYGIFGFEKRPRGDAASAAASPESSSLELGEKIAGDVANAVVAYAVVKVSQPLLCASRLFCF